MSDARPPEGGEGDGATEPAAPRIEPARRGPSVVWLVPLVAVLIGAFLVYRSFADRGPTVTIEFQSAAGLEAGKTPIKYKNVEIGLVDDIRLADDLSRVVVEAELVKGSERYLTDQTRFWVVRASVAAGRVTALDTLFSGAYIGLDPSTDGAPQRDFVGLEEAPLVTSDEPGRHFELRSEGGASFEVGAPVYFRKTRVGEVTSSRLDPSGEFVTTRIFVRSPYEQRVRENTRFWDASGLDLSLGAEGLRVDTEAFLSLVIGGVAFGAPPSEEPGDAAADGQRFALFANRREAFAQSYSIHRRYRIFFDHSVEGLERGAPVVLQGIKIGQVLDVSLQFDRESLEFRVPVLVDLEPERVSAREDIPDDPSAMIRGLIDRGLRARLKQGNLLTGAKQIELVFLPDAEPVSIETVAGIVQIPAVPTPLEELTATLTGIVRRIDALPIDRIGESLDRLLVELGATLESANHMVTQLDEEVLPSVAEAAEGGSAMLDPSSAIQVQVRELLGELTEAARSLRVMTDYLERHPESLLRGKGTP